MDHDDWKWNEESKMESKSAGEFRVRKIYTKNPRGKNILTEKFQDTKECKD